MQDRTHDEDRVTPPDTEADRRQLGARMRSILGEREEVATDVPGLVLIQRTQPVPPTSYVYEPSLAMIVRGRKHVLVGTASYWYDESRFLLTAINLPTITEVLEASPDEPYLSILLRLDLKAAAQIIAQLGPDAATAETPGAAVAVGAASPALFGAMARLVELVSTPADIPVVGDLVHRELLYRVLTTPAGARLRHIVRIGTQGHSVARAVTWLRAHYVEPLRVERLAKHCGLGVSTLHHHFRRLTSMSPLQFQKHLRLHEARRLLLSDELDARTVAFRVGYESATQFNREYRRLFGAPPMRDVKALRPSSAIPADVMKIL